MRFRGGCRRLIIVFVTILRQHMLSTVINIIVSCCKGLGMCKYEEDMKIKINN